MDAKNYEKTAKGKIIHRQVIPQLCKAENHWLMRFSARLNIYRRNH